VTGAGAAIGGAWDSFEYAWQPLSGDGEIVARIASRSGTSRHPSQRYGVMIREGPTPTAAYVFLGMRGFESGSISYLQYRTATGASTVEAAGPAAGAPYWVKLARQGNQITGYRSSDGISWMQAGEPVEVTMGATATAGLAVSSNDSGWLSTVVFDNVEVYQ